MKWAVGVLLFLLGVAVFTYLSIRYGPGRFPATS
jgi:hypothetical protein